MLGLGVMIQSLGGDDETQAVLKSAIGKTIVYVEIRKNKLVFKFTDQTMLYIFDDGQSCCENRYMDTDDQLWEYSDAVLLDFNLKDAPNVEDEYGVHEVQFLDVKTSEGVFTISSHNEHNGYYGGFWIVAKTN